MEKRDPKSNSPWLFPLLLVGVAGALFHLASSLDSNPTSQSEAAKFYKETSVSESRELVNRHLQMTNKKLELERDLVQQSNLREAPKVGMRIFSDKDALGFPKTSGIPMDSDRNEHNASNDLRKKPKLNFQEPGAEVQAEVREKIEDAEWTQQQREAFAQQYIENARRAGWEIRLSEDFVVIGVRKIGNGKAQEAYIPHGAGSN